jgi:Ca2+ transporting ATPase
MAYTSSFGEYNPGGGKDAVEKYLLIAKEQVAAAVFTVVTVVTAE